MNLCIGRDGAVFDNGNQLAQAPSFIDGRTEQSGAKSVRSKRSKRRKIMLGLILIVILLLALVGSFPSWPYSRGWGYYPTGGLGLVLLVVVILLLLGRL